MYYDDSDELMSKPIAAVVIVSLLLAYVRETSAVVSDTFTSV